MFASFSLNPTQLNAYTSYSEDLAELNAQFREMLRSPSNSTQELLLLAAQVSSLVLPQLPVCSSTGTSSDHGRRSSLSGREPVGLPPNPRPPQMACWEPSSPESDKPFVLESNAPFAPGVDALSASSKKSRARSFALTNAPRLKPFIPPASPEKLVLPLAEPLAAKKVRSLNIEEDLALLQISSKRTCSVSGSVSGSGSGFVVTFRI